MTSKRTPQEEQQFRHTVAEYMRALGPERIAMPDPLNPRRTIYVVPAAPADCDTCGDTGQAYDPRRGLIPCPDCWRGACPKCGGTGMYAPERHVTDPDFGKLELCPEGCAAARRLRHDHHARLYAAAQLPAEYQPLTLASFEAVISARPDLWQGKDLAYHAARLFIEAADNPDYPYYVDFATLAQAVGDTALPDWRNWLVLFGPRGVGKTGLMAAVVNALAEKGKVVRYTRVQDFINAIQARYGDDWRDHPPRDEYGMLDSAGVKDVVRKSPVLCLDEFDVADLGRGNKAAIMEDVIRYRHGQQLPTMVTTNLDDAGMEERWGETTVSVMKQRGHWVPMAGFPLRPVPQYLQRAW